MKLPFGPISFICGHYWSVKFGKLNCRQIFLVYLLLGIFLGNALISTDNGFQLKSLPIADDSTPEIPLPD